jgi:hypothetical protein
MAQMSVTNLANNGRMCGFGIGDARYFAEAFWRITFKAISALSVTYTFSRKAGICI